jgi:hypothetical protein
MNKRSLLTLFGTFVMAGAISSGYVLSSAAKPATLELFGTGTGLIDCVGGKSFQMFMNVSATQNTEGVVSGIITISDEDGATTNALIDEGKIHGNSFQIISYDPNSVEDVPLCHAGDDPDSFELSGVAGDDGKARFDAICEGEGDEGIECSSSKGTFEGTITISTG